MGSPRQTFAGETRSSRQCRWPRAAKGWSASQTRYILTFRNSLDPASLLKTKRRRIRTQRSQDCLPSENIYRRQKHQPHPKTPRHLPLGCRPFEDCLSYPPAYSLRGREKALSNKYEKLVVSRLENL